MPGVTTIVEEAIAELKANATDERRVKMATYAPTSEEVLGVAVPPMRRLATRLKRQLKTDPASALELASALVESGLHEVRVVGYLLLEGNRQVWPLLNVRSVERLGKGMDNWATVDGFACLVAGQAWRERKIPDRTVAKWARSKNRWWRRAALVSTAPLNSEAKGGAGDTPRTLKLCAMLVDDHDDMVVKAMSWALRELVKPDREAVVSFLKKHDTSLHSRVKREVRNVLETGLKNPKSRA